MISPAGATIPCEYMPSGGPSSFEVIALTAMATPWRSLRRRRSSEAPVTEVERLPVHTARRRRDPLGELSRLRHRYHEALDEGAVLLGGKPLVMPSVPLRLADDAAVGGHLHLGEAADGAVKAPVRQ